MRIKSSVPVSMRVNFAESFAVVAVLALMVLMWIIVPLSEQEADWPPN